MNKQKPASNSKSKKIDPTIKIAIIGGVVTLVSALITSFSQPDFPEHIHDESKFDVLPEL